MQQNQFLANIQTGPDLTHRKGLLIQNAIPLANPKRKEKIREDREKAPLKEAKNIFSFFLRKSKKGEKVDEPPEKKYSGDSARDQLVNWVKLLRILG